MAKIKFANCPDCGDLIIFDKSLGYFVHINNKKCLTRIDKNGKKFFDQATYDEEKDWERMKLSDEYFEDELKK